ncbi:hypothetical protein TNCV_4508901 [Trichonephila clavipes]|nr:hypothetical protein TNCV_4508901 [Trichonephila clavipes]
MNDNVRPYGAPLVDEFLESGEIRLMDRLARSPDLNSIKHVLDALRKANAARNHFPRIIKKKSCRTNESLEIKLINSFPPKIIWRSGIYPKLFDKMSDIEFHEGMPFDVEDITNAFVIIDDLMNEVGEMTKRTFKLVHERKPS